MERFLSVRGPIHEGGLTSTPQMAPRVVQYLTTVLQQQRGSTLTIRSERELRTLAEAMDSMMAGDLARCGDFLMQRFKLF